MDAKDFFINLISTDANCPVDVFAHKYNRDDLLRFAEAYHRARMEDMREADKRDDIDISKLGWPYDGTEDGER